MNRRALETRNTGTGTAQAPPAETIISGRRGLPRRSTVGLACLLLAFAGCMFSTRTPDPPGAAEVPWKDPTEERLVLENLRVTFNAKSVPNYNRSLVAEFTANFDPGDSLDIIASLPTFFDEPWDKSKEETALNAIFSQNAGTVTFSWLNIGNPLQAPDGTDDHYYQNLEYRMVFTSTKADTVAGKVDLYLRYSSGGWYISKWKDLRKNSRNPTLGLLRYKQRIGS